MANVAPSIADVAKWKDHAHVVTWTPITTTNTTGTAIEMPGSNDRSVQFTGTFGAAATIVIEGSNDGTNYEYLTDPQGNDISKTAADLEMVTELTRYIRPRLISGGDGSTSIGVYLLVRRE